MKRRQWPSKEKLTLVLQGLTGEISVAPGSCKFIPSEARLIIPR